MMVLGLTGSIAMGKSETAKMFARLGVPVFDSDAAVHALYEKSGAAVMPVARLVPEALHNGAIDRVVLSQKLAADPKLFAALESVVHPLVRDRQQQFLDTCRKQGRKLAVLDIPLLFETGREGEVDRIVVVSAPAEIQRARALARPGMSEEKLRTIIARQMPDAEKRRRADFVVDSSQGLDRAFAEVRHIVETVTAKA